MNEDQELGGEVVTLQQAIEVAAANLCQQEDVRNPRWHEGYDGGACTVCRDRVQIIAPSLHHAGRIQGQWWDDVAAATLRESAAEWDREAAETTPPPHG